MKDAGMKALPIIAGVVVRLPAFAAAGVYRIDINAIEQDGSDALLRDGLAPLSFLQPSSS